MLFNHQKVPASASRQRRSDHKWKRGSFPASTVFKVPPKCPRASRAPPVCPSSCRWPAFRRWASAPSRRPPWGTAWQASRADSFSPARWRRPASSAWHSCAIFTACFWATLLPTRPPSAARASGARAPGSARVPGSLLGGLARATSAPARIASSWPLAPRSFSSLGLAIWKGFTGHFRGSGIAPLGPCICGLSYGSRNRSSGRCSWSIITRLQVVSPSGCIPDLFRPYQSFISWNATWYRESSY